MSEQFGLSEAARMLAPKAQVRRRPKMKCDARKFRQFWSDPKGGLLPAVRLAKFCFAALTLTAPLAAEPPPPKDQGDRYSGAPMASRSAVSGSQNATYLAS